MTTLKITVLQSPGSLTMAFPPPVAMPPVGLDPGHDAQHQEVGHHALIAKLRSQRLKTIERQVGSMSAVGMFVAILLFLELCSIVAVVFTALVRTT